MNTTNSQIEVRDVPIMAPTPSSPPSSTGRLVVVLPGVVEPAFLARRILRAAGDREVMLLGICPYPVHEAELRRALALLAAFIRNAGTAVDIRLERGQGWLQALSAHVSDDDLLACCIETDSRASGRPLHDILSAAFRMPVYVFLDPETEDEPAKGIGHRLAPWLASLAVILGFLGLQITLTRSTDEAAKTLLLLLSLPVEVGMIWLCNALLP